MIASLGLQKTTLVDFPGRIAATIFTHGCPLRCPYCHNPELVFGPVPDTFLPVDEVFASLRRRSNVIESVAVTGGEPTAHTDLAAILERIHALDLAVKLDTSGAFPERLRTILNDGLADYVALDVKTSFGRYNRVGGNGEKVRRAIDVVTESGVACEFRCVLVPGLVDEATLYSIAEALPTGANLILTHFRPGGTLNPDWSTVPPIPHATAEAWAAALDTTHITCRLRGA